ncbi:LysR family transcriptional regulator [Streptosporangium lutulentum]
MDLDLAQVRAFVQAAGELHFGHAAEELSISQQALSKRIARLESTLGRRLLDRGGQGVRLTEAGSVSWSPPGRRWLPPTWPWRPCWTRTARCGSTCGATCTRPCAPWPRWRPASRGWNSGTAATCRR